MDKYLIDNSDTIITLSVILFVAISLTLIYISIRSFNRVKVKSLYGVFFISLALWAIPVFLIKYVDSNQKFHDSENKSSITSLDISEETRARLRKHK